MGWLKKISVIEADKQTYENIVGQMTRRGWKMLCGNAVAVDGKIVYTATMRGWYWLKDYAKK